MQRFAPQIEYYMEMFRRGDTDDAFHGLLEIDREIVPELIEVYRAAHDIGIRAFLIEVIWNYRDQSAIPLLGEALHDVEPRIWRQALDGLVTFASPDALDVLRKARTHQLRDSRATQEFYRWLEEAIEQTEAEAHKP